MEYEGDYRHDGYCLVRGLIPPAVAAAFLAQMRRVLKSDSVDLDQWPTLPLLRRPTLDFYSRQFPFMRTFLWGLTPAMAAIAARPLLPTYCYFRVYREGDVCRVHADRPACEHSLSLTLGSSDGRPWPLEVGQVPTDVGDFDIEDGFGEAPSVALEMGPGDAVAYRGTKRRHGRTRPNPNRWSAHLFLHFVDPDGPHAAEAFDGAATGEPIDFQFA